jgi:hypothetical protein
MLPHGPLRGGGPWPVLAVAVAGLQHDDAEIRGAAVEAATAAYREVGRAGVAPLLHAAEERPALLQVHSSSVLPTSPTVPPSFDLCHHVHCAAGPRQGCELS